MANSKHHVPYVQVNSCSDPLMKIEDNFCNLIISMSKFHYPITVSDALQLINYQIKNTEDCVKLNSLKCQCCGVTEENGKFMIGK